MASIHRQKGKANWFCAFTNFDGSRCFKSSGTPERARARLIADTMQRMVDMARRQDITIDRAKEAIAATLKRMESDGCPRFYAEQAREVLQEIADAILQGVGLQLPKASIRAFMDSWKRDKQASTAPATFHRYEVVVNKFLKHLDKKADRSVAALSAEEIRAWRDQIIPTISPASVNLHLKILRVALADAGREQLIERNVATLVPMLKTSKDAIRRAFTLPELKKLLTVANGEWRTMILTGLYTGLRMQDIATLTWANLDLQAGELTVVTNKTGRTQALPIAKPLMRHLETLPAGDDPKAPLCPALNGFGVALGPKLLAERIAAPALPDQGVMQGAAGGAVEYQHGLALVGDAQAGEIGQDGAIAFGNFPDDGEDILPDFLGIVFHPAGLGINLAMIAGGFVHDVARDVEEHRLGGGSALVNGEEIFHASGRMVTWPRVMWPCFGLTLPSKCHSDGRCRLARR